MFKIRNKDGLFSTGKVWPTWARVGRGWTNKDDLLAHVTSTIPNPRSYLGPRESFYTSNDEIVEFEMVEVSNVSLLQIF